MTANQFKRFRTKLWKNQREAAQALGVSQPTVTRWETGENPVPRMAQILIRKYINEAMEGGKCRN